MARLLRMLLLLLLISSVFSYEVIREYRGDTFFNDAQGNSVWTWFGNYDNLTLGDVNYLDEQDAFSQKLAYINSEGRAVLKVDNTTDVAANQRRNSVRITTRDTYEVGTLWIVDITHVPYGCSVWPAFWSVGNVWPDDGEIDIFEAINLQTRNQMALHTLQGCYHVTPPDQKGTSNGLDCSTDSGCVVVETSPNSYAAGFAAAGGGVWATQFDVTGVFMWFWSRPDIPASITQATSTSSMDISQWGPPSASYPSTNCSTSKYFGPQYIIFDITLCGVWAGVPSIYAATCANTGSTGICYNDNVPGPGSNYDNAYFEVSYLRTYTVNTSVTQTSVPASPASGTSVPSGGNHSNRAEVMMKRGYSALGAVVLAFGLLI